MIHIPTKDGQVAIIKRWGDEPVKVVATTADAIEYCKKDALEKLSAATKSQSRRSITSKPDKESS